MTPPRERADLWGHEAAERSFLEAWSADRLHHAWLIAGPEGIGKATLAFRIARFLLTGPDPGGGLFGAPTSLAVEAGHPVFRQVAAGAHPDLRVVERAENKAGRLRGEIVVEQVRPIAELMRQTASSGWRVVIIDAIDELNRNAANALLKLLEEPPPRALLLLVSHAPGGLLPTIRSRCRVLRLNPLADDLVRRVLPDLDPALLPMAQGSPGRALMLAEGEAVELQLAARRLVERPSPAEAHALAERLGRAGAQATWDAFCTLHLAWLTERARTAARAGTPAGALAPMVELWEKTGDLFARADSLNLDRKQVILDALSASGRTPTRSP